MKFKKTLLSLSIAAALSGCGDSGSSDSPDKSLEEGTSVCVGVNPDDQCIDTDLENVDEQNSGDGSSSGSSSIPVGKNSLVCIDVNRDALCNDEEVESVVTWVSGDVSTTLMSPSYPLVYEGEDGIVLTAAAGSDVISPTSTLLNNELIYNQIIRKKTEEDAIEYLNEKFGGDIDEVERGNFAAAVRNAILLHPDKDRYTVIAAVTNKAISLGNDGLSNVVKLAPNDHDIDNANLPSLIKVVLDESFSKNIDAEIARQLVDGWVDSNDSSISTLSAKNGKVIGGSHYHNGLTVIDVDAQSVQYTPVSVVTDHGHHIDSSTGASENFLREVAFNSDASYAYVNIPPKKISSNSNNLDTFGLYKVKIESDGSIATNTDGYIISIDETVSKRLRKLIVSYAVSNDDRKVATYDADEFFTVYDGDLENAGESIEIDNLEAFAISSDTVFTVSENELDAEKGDINSLSVSDLSFISKITLDFVPEELHLNDDGTKIIAFNHGHDNNGSMDIALVDTSDGSIETSSFEVVSDTAAISPDFTKLAIVGHEDKRLLILNLTVPGFSVQSSHSLESGSRDVSFVSDDQIAIINGRNSLAIIEITNTEENLNLTAKMDQALGSLNRASINGGGYLNAVIKDLTLIDHYENINITWSESGLTETLDVNDGSVVRPLGSESDVNGQLIANVNASFRGDVFDDSKSFDLTIRKVPMELSEAITIQTANNSSQYMAVNSDGDIMVAPVRFKNSNDDTVYGFVSLKLSNGALTIASGTEDTPKTFVETESLVGVGIYGDSIIGISAAVGDVESARIFTVAVDSGGVMANVTTNSVLITTGVPLKVGFNKEQSIAAVMIKKDDGSFITEMYSIVRGGAIVLIRTIDMMDAEYKSYGPPAINDDATVVYQRDSDNVILTASDGRVASAAVEDIARVWFYNEHVFVNTYDGNIISFNAELDESSRKIFSTGTGGRMYGAVGRELNGMHYLYIPLQRSSDMNSDRESELHGIYQLEIQSDGSLKEIAFSKNVEGVDRMAVSGDGDTVFFSYQDRTGDDKGRWFGAVEVQ